jgi:hypothetical protein
MNEWVYVLTIEALIFGLVSTTLIAQRIDVFTWPSDQTWPVFGTCVLVLLVYSLLLVFVCNVVKASRLDALTENVSHGMARGAGRLITAAALWVVLQSVSVYTFEKREWPLVLCQLCFLGVFVLCVSVDSFTNSCVVWWVASSCVWKNGVRKNHQKDTEQAEYECQHPVDSGDRVSIHDRRVLLACVQRQMPGGS